MNYKSAIIISMSVLAAAAALVLIFVFDLPNLIRMYTCDKSSAGYESEYTVDESGHFIANIPYDEYLTENADSNLEVYNIESFGARPDADFKTNRKAINSAIKEASANGGGMVLVDGGKYSCANIEMLSNVTLRIEKGSALTNITYEQDKSENAEFHSDEQNNTVEKNALIYANGAENITIEGSGRIEGSGASYCNDAEEDSPFLPLEVFNLKTYVYEHRKRIMPAKEIEMKRYFMLGINNCKNVTVRNLEIYEAGSWTCRMQDIDGLLFERVIINNNFTVANSDGIDIVGGSDVTIRKCFIATGDDAVCLKTQSESGTIDGVVVEDCELMSLANCFKIGTETYKDIKNVTVKGCRMFLPSIAGGYAGIAVEATDGARVSAVRFKNIEMSHITAPILVWLGYRHEGSSIDDVSFENISAVGCDLPSAVTGYKRGSEVCSVKNVSFKNVSVSYRQARQRLSIFPFGGAYEGRLNMGGYPEITRVSHMYIISHELSPYFDLPVYSLFVRNADSITVDGFTVEPRECETRPRDNLSQAEKYRVSNAVITG